MTAAGHFLFHSADVQGLSNDRRPILPRGLNMRLYHGFYFVLLCSLGACSSGGGGLMGNNYDFRVATVDLDSCDASPVKCGGCIRDSDCATPANPRCDAVTNRCVPCLPLNDNCG